MANNGCTPSGTLHRLHSPKDSASVELPDNSLKARPREDPLKWPLNPDASTASRDESKESDDVSDAPVDPPPFGHPHYISNHPPTVIEVKNMSSFETVCKSSLSIILENEEPEEKETFLADSC